jgi:hypothetical protein
MNQICWCGRRSMSDGTAGWSLTGDSEQSLRACSMNAMNLKAIWKTSRYYWQLNVVFRMEVAHIKIIISEVRLNPSPLTFIYLSRKVHYPQPYPRSLQKYWVSTYPPFTTIQTLLTTPILRNPTTMSALLNHQVHAYISKREVNQKAAYWSVIALLLLFCIFAGICVCRAACRLRHS